MLILHSIVQNSLENHLAAEMVYYFMLFYSLVKCDIIGADRKTKI